MRKIFASIAFLMSIAVLFTSGWISMLIGTCSIFVALAIAISRKFYYQKFFDFIVRSFYIGFTIAVTAISSGLLLANLMQSLTMIDPYFEPLVLKDLIIITLILAATYSLTIGCPLNTLLCESDMIISHKEDDDSIFKRAARLSDHGNDEYPHARVAILAQHNEKRN